MLPILGTDALAWTIVRTFALQEMFSEIAHLISPNFTMIHPKFEMAGSNNTWLTRDRYLET